MTASVRKRAMNKVGANCRIEAGSQCFLMTAAFQ